MRNATDCPIYVLNGLFQTPLPRNRQEGVKQLTRRPLLPIAAHDTPSEGWRWCTHALADETGNEGLKFSTFQPHLIRNFTCTACGFVPSVCSTVDRLLGYVSRSIGVSDCATAPGAVLRAILPGEKPSDQLWRLRSSFAFASSSPLYHKTAPQIANIGDGGSASWRFDTRAPFRGY